MARTLVSASSQKLVASSTPVTAVPLTFSAWWKSSNAAVFSAILSIDQSGGGQFQLNQDSSGHIQAATADGTLSTAATSTTVSAGVWCHACAVFANGSSRAAFLNGGGKGTNAAARAPTGINQVEIGHNGNGPSDGSIAECAMWNIALADADVLALSSGVAPYFIRPDGLVFYAPLLQGYSPEIDWVGGRTLTLTAAPALIDGPPIRYRSGLGALCA